MFRRGLGVEGLGWCKNDGVCVCLDALWGDDDVCVWGGGCL